MEIIIHNPEHNKDFEFLIGYIKKFTHKDPMAKEIFGDHPKVNGVYQLLKDENGYVIHTGKMSSKSSLQGIFIGPELSTDENPRWEYDIVILDKTNMLDYDLSTKEIKKIGKWLDTNHEELREALGILAKPKSELPKPVQVQDLMPKFVQNALIAEDHKNTVQHDISESLTRLLNSDPEILDSLSIFLAYLSNKKQLLPLRSYILNSEGPTATVSATMASLEAYDETGELNHILKTIETCLFEIQKFV